MSVSNYVIMGVSGSGKSHIGSLIARSISAKFIDGDDLHPTSNIKKMESGTPLNDDDRWPWLDLIAQELKAPNVVIACSALKRSYRDRIRRGAGTKVIFVYLDGKLETLTGRMNSRDGHFMPPKLLESQLAALERPQADEAHIVLTIENSPEQMLQAFQTNLEMSGAGRVTE